MVNPTPSPLCSASSFGVVRENFWLNYNLNLFKFFTKHTEATSRKRRNIVATLRQVANLINICICPNQIMPSAVATQLSAPTRPWPDRVAFTACHKLRRVSGSSNRVDSRSKQKGILRIRHVFVSRLRQCYVCNCHNTIKKAASQLKLCHCFTWLKIPSPPRQTPASPLSIINLLANDYLNLKNVLFLFDPFDSFGTFCYLFVSWSLNSFHLCFCIPRWQTDACCANRKLWKFLCQLLICPSLQIADSCLTEKNRRGLGCKIPSRQC